MFLKLQGNYCYVRVHGGDDAEELKLAEKDAEQAGAELCQAQSSLS